MHKTIKLKGFSSRVAILANRERDFIRLTSRDPPVLHLSSDLFRAHFARTRFPVTGDFHIALTITKATVSPLAVHRNYIRRVMKAAINQNIRRFPSLARLDILFFMKRAAGEVSFAELGKAVRKIFAYIERKTSNENGTGPVAA
ncbi:MAG: ribonuclease P protein component [Rickettsiales bacterium]|jgi:ribonuclease P protein component|nr:ribonuclease P protein component [Rickettsiales bacterium]